jgi:hypothetical protein
MKGLFYDPSEQKISIFRAPPRRMVKKPHFSGSFYDRPGRSSKVLRGQFGQKYNDKKVRNTSGASSG